MKKMMVWMVLGLVLVVVLSGCNRAIVGSGGDAPTPAPVVAVEGTAVVDTVDVLVMESFPVQVSIAVKGNLPDGCTELGEMDVTRDGTTFRVSVLTTRPEDAACTQALVPYELKIPLDVVGLDAGTYTVDVNGAMASFILAVDNVAVEEPVTEPVVNVAPCEALAADGEAVFVNAEARYCLRYPAEFTVTEPEPGVVVIHGPDYGGGPEPLTGFVNIQASQPAEGRSLAEVVEMLLPPEDLPVDAMVEKVEVPLGGVRALEIIGVPGLRTEWHVVAVQNDRIVHLVFSPVGLEYAQAASDMDRLYLSVMRSFTFLRADGTAETPTAAEAARFVLGQALGTMDIEIVSAEPFEFSDSCLGLGGPAESCLAAITPGYKVTLAAGGATYVYHVDEMGGNVRVAEAPAEALDAPVISWRNEFRGQCSQAAFALDRGAAGRCDAPMVVAPLNADWVTRNLPYFVETFAPFAAETMAGTVAFTGTGSLGAMPAEQQSIAEFARIAAGIVESGHEGASYGLAVTLHREGGLLGSCENIEVYVSGEIFISSCKGETPEQMAYGRLTALELERLYSLLDTYTFTEWADDSALAYDGLAEALVFFGRGDVSASDVEVQALLDLAGRAYSRLVFGEINPGDGPMWVALPESWTVGQTRETLLGTLTVIGEAPMDPRAENSAIYVADATDVSLEQAVKRIFCGPSDCTPNVVLEDVTIAGLPAKRSVPADNVKIAWYFMSYGGKTITFTLYDTATYRTLDDVVEAIRIEPAE
ncbi:MAG: hypothetical protein ACYCYF_11550 [Anaerolineae bacterium]